jgi:polyferredoxin
VSALKSINLAISFLLELALVGTVAFWGLSLSMPILGRVLLGLALPTAVVVIWALFMAPRAKRRVPDRWKPVLTLAMFVGVSALLIMNGHGVAAGAFVVVAVLNTIGLYALRRYPSPLDAKPDSGSP